MMNMLLRVPALRDHAQDIPMLVDHFIKTICHEYGTSPKAIDPEAIDQLKKMQWGARMHVTGGSLK